MCASSGNRWNGIISLPRSTRLCEILLHASISARQNKLSNDSLGTDTKSRLPGNFKTMNALRLKQQSNRVPCVACCNDRSTQKEYCLAMTETWRTTKEKAICTKALYKAGKERCRIIAECWLSAETGDQSLHASKGQ